MIYPLFMQGYEKRSCENCNSQTISVDQLGLEPRTSRL